MLFFLLARSSHAQSIQLYNQYSCKFFIFLKVRAPVFLSYINAIGRQPGRKAGPVVAGSRMSPESLAECGTRTTGRPS